MSWTITGDERELPMRRVSNVSSSIAFGPVPSRRLGRSLGINNIPAKVCSYSCVYCQIGRTVRMPVERQAFYEIDEILRVVERKIKNAASLKESIDFLSFVPDGEPTLDLNLGREIRRLKPLGLKIAVISNSSLIWRKDVRDELGEADWVSLKIDALSPDVWRKINRPHGSLRLGRILDGISEFASAFKGELATETMLVQGLNDREEEIGKISDFIAKIAPKESFISVPTRPPAEKNVRQPSELAMNMAYQVFTKRSIPTEFLIGYEGNAFAFTGDVREDLLSITAVHPMRDDAVRRLLKKAAAEWDVVEKLVKENELAEIEFDHRTFYIRKPAGRLLRSKGAFSNAD
jgi:wyosine [tRNA(Phe)-imidazoG37] synthetase (radical SAM superfamily)